MTQTEADIQGGCLCGAVRFRSAAAPVTARICWCRLCQKIGAGSGTVNVVFPAEAVTIDGQTTDFFAIADSGARMHRRFCPTCGTPMFSQAESRPHHIVVRAGVLDDPEIAKPSAVIWAAQAPTWACIDTNLQQFPAQP